MCDFDVVDTTSIICMLYDGCEIKCEYSISSELYAIKRSTQNYDCILTAATSTIQLVKEKIVNNEVTISDSASNRQFDFNV